MSVERLHDPQRRDFGSDNFAGVHPEVLAALATANLGHQPGYGADVYTDRLREVVRREFGPRAEVYPVFNGTGANIVALQAMAQRWEAVVCAESAHLHTDECAAPEHHGFKLLTVPAPDGLVRPDALPAIAADRANRHHAQSGVLSLSQSTELGTCYSPDELRALTSTAHRLGLRVHLDGARLANAAAHLGASLRELTTDAGIDVLSFGATKNGAMFGDCVIVLDPDAVAGLPYLKKASTQLPSKTRFISAQLLALLEDGLWLRSARHANAMADRLQRGLVQVPGARITHPVQANAVFAVLPDGVVAALRERWTFSTWHPATGEVRLMTSFDTTADDVDALVDAAHAATGRIPA
ncbi:threonine aldolase family protein [Pimelobacter simplex]|uniref:threonine aldolase family protein n=1 Tax=Nocardioides simplex TaxID=2045 RepID=UPI0019316610|nr:threonine aldolase [Pimelobacter simplex]